MYIHLSLYIIYIRRSLPASLWIDIYIIHRRISTRFILRYSGHYFGHFDIAPSPSRLRCNSSATAEAALIYKRDYDEYAKCQPFASAALRRHGRGLP